MPLYDEPNNAPAQSETCGPRESATVYETKPKERTTIVLEGDPWQPLDYFSQILAADDTPRRLDLGLSATLQQYIRVKNFVILQTDKLTHSTDEDTITVVEGSGTIYPALVPNVADHFIGRMSDGRWGFFVIKTVSRVKYYAYTAWDVTYELVDYLKDDVLQNLTEKTQDTWYWDSDNPLELTKSEKSQTEKKEVAQHINELVKWWFDEFYDLRTQTALHPGINEHTRLYDDAVVHFMKAIIPYKLQMQLPSLKVYELPTGEYQQSFRTVWDVILDGETTGLRRINNKVDVMSVESYGSRLIYTTIAMAQMGGVVHPVKAKTLQSRGPKDAEQQYYVFTENFYKDDTTKMTKLENMVSCAINQGTSKTEDLFKEIDDLYDKSSTEQFFFIPVLIWLLLRKL